MTKLVNSTERPRWRVVAYWVTTGLLALECGVGGVMSVLRLSPFSEIINHLGYPAYFMTIIGVWYMLGGVAVLAPRLPRLKEWAYAGLIFVYTGAVASHLAVGDPVVTLIAPVMFTGLVVVSWALRPVSRRVGWWRPAAGPT
jgi:uncharacterized membrane protein YphA (DoxX/SURF4 family)